VKTVFLPSMSIERCRQCNDDGCGICRSEGKCVIEDDSAGLPEQIRSADATVFATPVYFSDLCESIRAFLDRLRRTTRHEAGQQGISHKPALGLCLAGGGGGGAPACAEALQKILARGGFDVLETIPVRRQNLSMKEHLLRKTGAWLAGCPSSEQAGRSG